MKTENILITGIGTGVGKTVSSAVLVEKLKADYWKPIQAGNLDHSDTDIVRRLVPNPISKFHPEAYRLNHPFSPHQAAHLDKVKINMDQIKLPKTANRRLIIEGVGGLMVPLNEQNFMIDLIAQLRAEVILVISHYLGSINHSLLSIELLTQRNIPIKGLIINGNLNSYSEDIILNYKTVKFIGRIDLYPLFDEEAMKSTNNKLDTTAFFD